MCQGQSLQPPMWLQWADLFSLTTGLVPIGAKLLLTRLCGPIFPDGKRQGIADLCGCHFPVNGHCPSFSPPAYPPLVPRRAISHKMYTLC